MTAPSTLQSEKPLEAYRVLFPLGLIFGIVGAAIWILYAFSPRFAYPAQLHSQLMIGTFLFAFASGFLMTAIPKMTASFPAKPFELVIACGLVLANAVTAYLGRSELFYCVSAISLATLILFFVRRFIARTRPAPPFFPFVLSGLLSGLIGAFLLLLPAVISVSSELQFFGKRLYMDGMILFLVLGIGSRLIPVISGRGMQDEKSRFPIAKYILLSSLLILGFAFQAYGHTLLGGILKIIVMLWVAYFNWGILAKAKTKSRLALGMRVSAWMVVAGVCMATIQPSLATHWMHLCYMAGFGLMTLTVASRVTLAHGGYDLSYEAGSPALWICGALILTAAATRVAAPFIASAYISHLFYAALIWVLALLLWGVVFVKRMIWRGDVKDAC